MKSISGGFEVVASIPFETRENIPQGLKPAILLGSSARLKAVPFQSAIDATGSGVRSQKFLSEGERPETQILRSPPPNWKAFGAQFAQNDIG